MTQQFWSAKYASANTATSSIATEHMADVPDVDVKMHASTQWELQTWKEYTRTNNRINEKANEKMSR